MHSVQLGLSMKKSFTDPFLWCDLLPILRGRKLGSRQRQLVLHHFTLDPLPPESKGG